jgi:hypothetical protein
MIFSKKNRIMPDTLSEYPAKFTFYFFLPSNINTTIKAAAIAAIIMYNITFL